MGVATLVAPLEALLAFFLYLDLRARQEALTLAKLAAEAARPDAAPPAG